MTLDHLTILNFKNIASAELDFSPRVNCFVGSNGAGKTNLLDAIHFLSICRSMTSAPDAQLIRDDEPFFMIEGRYGAGAADGSEPAAVQERICCSLKRGGRKRLKRGEKEYIRLSEHLGLIPVVAVMPSDMQLVEGGSEGRRRLLDLVVAQYDPAYSTALRRYANALSQRGVLLRQEAEPDPGVIGLWEEQMAVEGELIYRSRLELTERLLPAFQRYYNEISGGAEAVGVEYVSHASRGPLLEVISQGRAKDRIMGWSLHGVHRDDLLFTLDGRPMKQAGSQGQRKSFVVALKLAAYDCLVSGRRACACAQAEAKEPLLLLDDIFDKLDAGRVERIVRLVAGGGFSQVFVTDTNREHIDRLLTAAGIGHKLFVVDDRLTGRTETIETTADV